MKKSSRSTGSLSAYIRRARIVIEDLHLPMLWSRARRTVIYGLILILFLLLQNVAFSHITLFGAHSMFMPALVVAVALFEGGPSGGWFGLAAGILTDLFCAGQTVLFTVFFPVLGFAVGFMADFFLNRRFFTYCIMAVIALILATFLQMFSLIFYKGQGCFALFLTGFLQVVWSIPFIFPAYYVCRLMPYKYGKQVPSPY